MKKIKYDSAYDLNIKFEKIKPFYNVCRVTGVKEKCNIIIEYTPSLYILEIESYRDYFNKVFNMYIEELAETTFDKIFKLIKPKHLKVTVFLEDKKLTPWSVTAEL